MGDGTEQNPYTREDVLRLIEENGGTAKGLNLSNKYFEENIDLSCLDLKGINLIEANFKGANLVAAHLEGSDLMGAHLEGTNLGDVHLEGSDLMGAHLEGSDLMGAHLEGSDLGDAHLNGAALGWACLEGTDLGGSNLEGAVLENVEFHRNTNLDNVKWGNYILGEEREGEEREGNDRIMWFNLAATTYRRLKIWYAEHGMYDVAGEFFFREMTAKRKAMKWRPSPLNRASSKLISMLCGYGERPSNVVISALVVIFGLATVYVYGGLDLPYSMYFSAVSFTALGYGSWAHTPPSNWVQGLGAFESFLGVFMMALFLITFTRKMTR